MTTAAARSRVPGMTRRVVDYFQAQRSESGHSFAQSRFKFKSRSGWTSAAIWLGRRATARDLLVHAGQTFLKGLTTTLAYTPAAT